MVTVWLAFTQATEENGCVQFIPNIQDQLPHVEVPGDATNLLLKGQRIPSHLLDFFKAFPIPLVPGQATIHALRCVHASGPNRSGNQRRIGLAIRYMATHVKQIGPLKEGAMLVQGSYTEEGKEGSFELRPPPQVDWDAQGLDLHKKEMETMKVQYVQNQQQQQQGKDKKEEEEGEGGGEDNCPLPSGGKI